MTLSDKISEIEAFERTPAGAALKRFRSALQVAVLEDERDDPKPGTWTKTRAAEQELMAEIRKLQERT